MSELEERAGSSASGGWGHLQRQEKGKRMKRCSFFFIILHIGKQLLSSLSSQSLQTTHTPPVPAYALLSLQF